MLKRPGKYFWGNKAAIILIIIGTITWSLTMVKSGLCWKADAINGCQSGFGYWGANGHDGIWHVALAEGLSRGFGDLSRGSLGMPIFAGSALQNYHLGFDLLLALANKVTDLPISFLYFQIFPLIFAFLIGLLTYKFVFLWTKSRRSSLSARLAGLYATFFVYFGGSFAWILGKGESAFWSQQAISTLINPPFAMSLIFILLGLICLQKKKYILSILFFGILIQIKVYAGILVLIGLFFSKNFKVFWGMLILSLILFLPSLKTSSRLLVWQPFWFLETMMQFSDRVGWAKFGEAMVNYKAGGIWFKGILAYGTAFLVFLIGNLGTRILAIRYPLSAIRRELSAVEIFILSVIAAGVVIPMLFLQKGTPWNTIQFFYYSLFFSGILAGVAVARTVHRSLLIVLMILLTVPTTMMTLKTVYLPSRPPAELPLEELKALEFLSEEPQGIVLTYPFDRYKAKKAESAPPRPLYLYESTAYVAAFSKQPVFLEDEVNLDITGYDWRTRRAEIENWYQEKDQVKAREFLKRNEIKYVYWLQGQRAFLGERQLGLEKIFGNKEVDIYVVKS